MGFKALYDDFKAKDVVVIGISKDSAATHKKFAEKNGLSFILLADPDTSVLQKYEVWQEKKMYGKVSMGVVRTTYVISEKGEVEKVFTKVKPETSAAEVLEYLG